MTAVLVFGTIVLFLIVDTLRSRSRHVVVPRHAVPVHAFHADFFVPEGLFVGAGHTWARLEGDGSIRIGVDDFASRLLGRVDRLEVAAEGVALGHDDAAFVLHQGSKSVALAAPIAGTVTAVNTEALRHPQRLRDEPYEHGWLLRLRPRQLASDLRHLRIGDEARDWLQGEAARFGAFIGRQLPADAVGATLQDGGLPANGVLEHLDGNAWESFEEEFLAGR